jgi:dolichol-phosphate mannosyltransferase
MAALDRVDVRSNGYSFQLEITYYSQLMGFRVTEEPILFEERVHAKSKMSRSEIGMAMYTLLRLSFRRFSGRGAVDRHRLVAEGLGPKAPG